MMNKLAAFLVLALSLIVVQLPVSSSVEAAEKKEKRKTQLVSPNVGKKVARAFEAYSADDIDGALVILKDISANKVFDKAYVTRFLAVMYAQKGDEVNSIKHLKEAIEPDVLSENDHGEAIKLLADLQMQTKDFDGALANYAKWMDFTGKEDANTYVKITQAYYELGSLDKMIVPADKAITLYGDKHNQNPYILKLTSYYERKMYKDGVNVLETVLQIFPDKKQWWTQLGMFYLLVEDYQKGVQTLDLAYKQGFLEKESQIKTLASLYSQNEAPYKAAILLEKNIASGLVTRDDKNLSIIANAWHAAQHIDKAAKYYGELAKMTGEARHYRKQGMLLKQDEQFAKAIVAFDKALELGVKGSGRIYQSIAESYFYLEKYKPAYVAIKEAMKDPKTRKSSRGWVNFIKDTAKRKNISI
jgi:tetratricopeptide (TPR) repeat protein